MENLCCRSRLYHLHIIISTQLQETLNARRRVLGTLPLVTMGQHQGKATVTAPFGLTRRDELVNNNLGTIGKVTELSLPDGEYIGLGGRVAILECHYSLFGEYRINHCE